MSRPGVIPPIGLRLARTSRVVTQAFERAMAAAGGSASAWQVLLLVRSEQWGTQSRMAEAMGITGATLTHHLNALESQGLVRRWREESNRRVQKVALTDEGAALFERLREVAVAHDARLRSQLSEEETAQLAALLEKLEAAVTENTGGSRDAAVAQVAPASPEANTSPDVAPK
jgi:MarR family transcriptional regulator, transcriptional regulator for hemolysin